MSENAKIYEAMLAKLGEFSSDLSKIKSQMEAHQKISAETHMIVAGNGDPKEGLATKFELLRKCVENLAKKLDIHLTEHQKNQEKKEERIWDLVKPIFERFLVAFFTVAIVLGAQALLGG
jgi:hypothetical protein